MKTVSAPAGIAAPVKMRMASPGFSDRFRARAGHETAGHRKRGVAVRPKIRVPHGITIDGRIVERRQIDRSFHIVGNDAAARAMQRHAFDFGDRCDPLADQPLHIVEPQQRTGKSEAVVGELRHYRAPCGGGRIRRADRHRALEQQIGDRLDVVEIDHRHFRLRQRDV